MKKTYITPRIAVHVLDEDLCTRMLTASNYDQMRTPGNDTSIPVEEEGLPEIKGDELGSPDPA